MTDRPIIFSAPMVRALLDGRKTQTRRVLKIHPDREAPYIAYFKTGAFAVWADEEGQVWRFPHAAGAAVGDRLYVRENWQALSHGDYLPTKAAPPYCDVRYAATDALAELSSDVRGYPWRPSIHMPRWASRLTLSVTEVLVQRLQEITEADALAEGCAGHGWVRHPTFGICTDDGQVPSDEFRDLWNSLHGPDAWDANPWVVAVSFTVERRNIDSI